MPVSRRGFFGLLGAREAGHDRGGLAALMSARGREADIADLDAAWHEAQARQATGQAGQTGRGGRPPLPPGVEEIRISSNENPLGPGKVALDAILGKFPEAGRYPFNSTPSDGKLIETIAALHKTKAENIVLGAGSQEILRNAVRAFTSTSRHLVAGAPTFENCTGLARRWKFPVVETKVDSQFRIDPEAMIATVRGGGLVFFNNPNKIGRAHV